MSRNGSGVYSLAAGNPVTTGTTISSSWANNTLTDIASALTASIASDGQTVITANLPMSTYAHTGVGVATARTMYGTAGQIQDNTLTYLTTIAGTNVITAVAPVLMSAYATGQTFYFIAAGGNTGAVTVNINAIGAKSVKKTDGSALVSGDILTGAAVQIMYDGTNFQLLSDRNGTNETVGNLTVTGTTTATGLITANGGVSGALNGSLGATTPSTVVATTITAKGATSGSTTIQATDAVTATITLPSTTSTLADIYSASIFYKSDIQSVAFTKTGAGTVSIKAGTKVAAFTTLLSFTTDTAITMPTLTAGTDYAIYVCTDGTVRADANFTAPSGYTVGNSRQIGGFHYAPGGVAAAQAGGNTTPAINEYSLWDIKFRPSCTDPRGMALIAGNFWADIYLLGVDYLTNGSSKYNVTIADGSSPPKRSTLFGGNGTTTYADGNWWNLNEALKQVGKRSPTYSEFAALAYGTTEATSSGGTDVPTTGVSGTGATSAWNLFTSKFGIIQASGCLWIWGDEFGGPYGTAAYTANTQSRGSTYNLSNAVLLGGYWVVAAASGSRASFWNFSPTVSSSSFGARGVCDHLTLV
jgi:hypothetical protein